MSNVEHFKVPAVSLTEFEALTTAAPSVLDAIPGAVYLCDHEGWVVRCNSEAIALWGRPSDFAYRKERFCGSHRLFLLDGRPLPHEECPMADAVRSGSETRNAEVVIERPDGSRITALVNIRPLKDHVGRVQGAINCLQDITARKQAEAEVGRKTQELEDFFENSAVGLHIVSGEGIILRANKAELELLGYTADEYVGRHVAEFHADPPVIGDILKRLSCGERLDRYPARLRAKDGSVKHVLITSNSRIDDGRFVNTRCFTTDVTDLHQAELSRRASDERLAATYEAAPVGIAEADEQGHFMRVNDGLCNITGRSREELSQLSFLDYTHPDDKSADAERYALQVEGKLEAYSIRKRILRPDGVMRYISVSSSSVRDGQGRFRYGVRVIQDVTETQRLEDRLRESEQHMRELLEALPAAVYTTDSNGRITFYNKAAVEMAGRTPQAGDEWCVTWRLYRPDGTPLPHDECPMAVALKEDRPVRGQEAIAERPDGTRIPFIPYPTPLHDAHGRLVGAINMLVDISERKEAENQQRILIDELNHRVKNTLAIVQSLSLQTARHAPSIDEFTSSFQGRILALARAHDLLSKRRWQDAPLDTLIRDLIEPIVGGAQQRAQLDGPKVEVTPRVALNLTMVLNELLTNAAKYGSLSTPGGLLGVSWRLGSEADRKVLAIDWRERGGPRVEPPKRRGFGSRLMERCIEGDLAGAFDLAFEPAGVQVRLSVPLGPDREGPAE